MANNYKKSSGNSRNTEQKKHSGAKSGMDKNGVQYVRGWNYSKSSGMVSFYAAPYKGSSVHTSNSGRDWVNFMVKVSPKMAKPFIVSGLYDTTTRKVIIPELGIVMNPNAPNGGYCGKFSK